MTRNIAFDEKLVCDECGDAGAFDLMGDYFCSTCLDSTILIVDAETMARINTDVEYWREKIWADLSMGTRPSILVFEALGKMEEVQKEFRKWYDWRLRMAERGKERKRILEETR